MTPLSGTFWRLIERARAGEVLAPALSPEGRFHHQGQRALYLSQSEEGTRVAMARYIGAETPELIAVAIDVPHARVLDLRDAAQCVRFGIGPEHENIVWQDLPRPSPTWAISDAARATGADGMLYRSRSRPDLTHLVLFRWNAGEGANLTPRAAR